MEHGSRARTIGRVLAIAVPIVLIGTLFSMQDSSRAPPSVSENTPDIFADKARVTEFDRRGQVLYGIEAVRLEYFEPMQSTLLTSPSMVIHSEDALPWHVVARHGKIKADGARNNIVTLEDNVVLHQERLSGDFVVITTQLLTVYPERRYAITDQDVTIKTEATVSRGVGLEVDLGQSRFTLSSDPDDRGSIIIEPET